MISQIIQVLFFIVKSPFDNYSNFIVVRIFCRVRFCSSVQPSAPLLICGDLDCLEVVHIPILPVDLYQYIESVVNLAVCATSCLSQFNCIKV